jgi:hypothetical protein
MPVESTKSQNITVTCRRSPVASVGGGAGGAGWGGSVVWRSLASTSECLDADDDFPGSDAEAWRDPVGAAPPAVVEMGGKVFGYPVAQENDAERAVRAALAIQRTGFLRLSMTCRNIL